MDAMRSKYFQAAVLLLATALSYGAAYASVGYVQFASSGVSIKGADGAERAALKGMDLNSGDTIATGGGRAQLRFSDGAYVSLQPESVFRIDEYRYAGTPDGTEKGFFSLLKGGVRTITGWVGRLNRDNYKVVTPEATIGIRGTEYLAALGGSLTVSVGEGRIAVTNQTGEFVVEAGQSVYVANQNSRPAVTSDKPFLPPDPMKEGLQPPSLPGFAAADQVNTQGQSLLVVGVSPQPPQPPQPPLQNPYAVANGDHEAAPGGTLAGAGAVDASCNSAGACQKLNFTGPGGINFNRVAALNVENGFDGIIGWGRWAQDPARPDAPAYTASGSGNTRLGPNQGLHYVYGEQTPPAQLPTANAFYSLVGATQATSSDGSLGLGTFSGTLQGGNVLQADFTAGTVNVGFQVDFGNNGVYAVNNQQLALSGATFAGAAVPATGPNCGAGCTGSVNGFFAGPAAERAGLGYQITDPSSLKISGAAALAKN
ncbi:MAG TPA: FecR family protein [Burkholderiales bacterium]